MWMCGLEQVWSWRSLHSLHAHPGIPDGPPSGHGTLGRSDGTPPAEQQAEQKSTQKVDGCRSRRRPPAGPVQTCRGSSAAFHPQNKVWSRAGRRLSLARTKRVTAGPPPDRRSRRLRCQRASGRAGSVCLAADDASNGWNGRWSWRWAPIPIGASYVMGEPRVPCSVNGDVLRDGLVGLVLDVCRFLCPVVLSAISPCLVWLPQRLTAARQLPLSLYTYAALKAVISAHITPGMGMPPPRPDDRRAFVRDERRAVRGPRVPWKPARRGRA
ncbi:hypothetical protein JB92DRAFT_2829861 [Gautieria morchelliformis]|nr:hypothetical protein JB92DRAFT_2829861 [Gautieria morchelliformis]